MEISAAPWAHAAWEGLYFSFYFFTSTLHQLPIWKSHLHQSTTYVKWRFPLKSIECNRSNLKPFSRRLARTKEHYHHKLQQLVINMQYIILFIT